MARFGRRRAAGSVAPRGGGRVAAYGALGALARLIEIVVAVVAAIIALGVLLVVLSANRSNEIVKAILDAAEWLVGPFKDVFTLDDRKLEVAVNWGLALLIYVVVARGIAGLLRRPRP
jgi:acyl-CoA synthetase (AMP-forming)/AMP-acid ligase II